MNSTNLFLSEYLTPPIAFTRPLLLCPLTFFDEFYESLFIGISHSSHRIYSTTSSLSANFFSLAFSPHVFLLMTLKLNPLSSQNHTCSLFGSSFAIFKYSANFWLNSFLFSGFCRSSKLYLAQI